LALVVWLAQPHLGAPSHHHKMPCTKPARMHPLQTPHDVSRQHAFHLLTRCLLDMKNIRSGPHPSSKLLEALRLEDFHPDVDIKNQGTEHAHALLRDRSRSLLRSGTSQPMTGRVRVQACSRMPALCARQRFVLRP